VFLCACVRSVVVYVGPPLLDFERSKNIGQPLAFRAVIYTYNGLYIIRTCICCIS